MKKWFMVTVLMLSFATFSPPVVQGRDVGHYEAVTPATCTQVTGLDVSHFIKEEISEKATGFQANQAAILQPVTESKTVSMTAYGHAIRLCVITSISLYKNIHDVASTKNYFLHIDPGLTA